MGRNRKVVGMNKHHFTKAEIEERQNAEQTFKVGRDQLESLPILNDRAKAEFNRIKDQAHWLDNLDLNDLALYCFCWDKVQSVMEKYSNSPEVLNLTGADGSPKLIGNPLRKAIRDYSAEMRSISSKLGLSSIDRLKLVVPSAEKPVNKFFKFF